MILFLKASSAEHRMPKTGERIEFLSDLLTDKGPATGRITGTKVTVDGLHVTVEFADGQQMFSWDDLDAAGADVRGDLWMVKAHPVIQAVAAGVRAVDLNDGETRRNPGEPSPSQAEADTYKKPALKWRGLTIRIENPAGSVRRGHNWETRMKYDYGYVARSEGVDGDEVDVYIGPHADDAETVYVVHQRKYGKWDQYDEDKCMIGFLCQDDAEAAYLAHYDDPRFLGPVTAMPADEFIEKVRATKESPKMIKSMVLFIKSQVKGHSRRTPGGKIVFVKPYNTKTGPDPEQADMFAAADEHGELPPGKVVGAGVKHKPKDAMREFVAESNASKTKKFYVTMIRDPGPRQRVAYLAGPFDNHDDALAKVDAARKIAEDVDGFASFDAFGTTGVTAAKHPPGVLNSRMGVNTDESILAGDSKKRQNKGEPKGDAMNNKAEAFDPESNRHFDNAMKWANVNQGQYAHDAEGLKWMVDNVPQHLAANTGAPVEHIKGRFMEWLADNAKVTTMVEQGTPSEARTAIYAAKRKLHQARAGDDAGAEKAAQAAVSKLWQEAITQFIAS